MFAQHDCATEICNGAGLGLPPNGLGVIARCKNEGLGDVVFPHWIALLVVLSATAQTAAHALSPLLPVTGQSGADEMGHYRPLLDPDDQQ